ncbi:MAG: hypothetical protein H5U08_10620 [Thermogutta sp.]|uniref:hypothetical protein n=1 Tax=Thermogutta sp. TaxID=1962930 RepID=UPI0019CDEAB4|nr:hypothetical protein [Thermogutta sp.]MBC7352803.1 hypothetical protein [Thermogutta sp.]
MVARVVERIYRACAFLTLCGTVFVSQQGFAGIIYNGGFENDFSVMPNWSVSLAGSGTLQRVASWTALADATQTIYPKEGAYFLLIKSDEDAPTDTILRQSVALSAGEIVSGWMAIDAYLKSYTYADSDYAQIRIFQDSTILFSKTLTVDQLDGDRSLLNWQFWSWTAPATGTYTIELRAMDDTTKYGAMTWWGLFDGIAVTAAVVPEPSVGAALISGLVMAMALGRLRHAKNRITPRR